jgi:pyridoxal 5'-phosphate synthase pdxT subunit
MGLIGTHTLISVCVDPRKPKSLWDCLKEFSRSKPTWGTCAGMILLAEKCVGTSAVIEDGQSLIGGIDITVCRNYFGSQVSSFEMETPAPPGMATADRPTYPGVFIRAPAILSAAQDVDVLGKVVATPCRQAAVTLQELERKVSAGEDVVKLGVVDALERDSAGESTVEYRVVVKDHSGAPNEEKKDGAAGDSSRMIVLPGAADGTNAREVICAVRKGHLLCTAFHPELTDDHRWHDYFMRMVEEAKSA